MSVWRPWDADDVEYEERSLVRELIPSPLRAPLLAWVRRELHPTGGYAYATMSRVHALQTALQINFQLERDYNEVERVVSAITRQGDQFTSRVVDYFLSLYPYEGRVSPANVALLKSHLDNAASVLDVTVKSGTYRLKRRVAQGIEELAEASRSSGVALAGQHLGKAWAESYSLTPDTSLVMSEAIKAVEAAAHPVVTPNDLRVRLGKIVQTVKDQHGWTLAFPTRDDGHPDHRAVLVGMLETLIVAQADRHGGKPPSVLEAQGHVQLASTLVQWFSTGVVLREAAR